MYSKENKRFKYKRVQLITCDMITYVITCDEFVDAEDESYSEETKTVTTNSTENKAACKTQNFYILFAFLFITIALLITVSIYCYLIRY